MPGSCFSVTARHVTFYELLHCPEDRFILGTALLGGLFEPVKRLLVAPRDAMPVLVHHAEVEPGHLVLELSGLLIPLCRHFVIPRDAIAVLVHSADASHGVCIALLRGLTEPFKGLSVIMLNSRSLEVELPGGELGARIAALGGLQMPFEPQGVIPAVTILLIEAQIADDALGLSVTLPGSAPPSSVCSDMAVSSAVSAGAGAP